MAAMTRDAADAFYLGDDQDDVVGFDAVMSVFSSDGGLEVGQAWCAVNEVLRQDIPDLDPFWVGEPVTDDLGYGPAFFASPETVQRLAATLAGLTENEAYRRLDAAIDAGAIDYPAIWDRDDESEENRQWAIDSTMRVIGLYERAAVNGLGMFALLL